MLAALDCARDATDFLPGLEEPIPQPLMIAFPVIMTNVTMDCTTQHVFAEEDHPVQTFLA